MNIWFLAKTDSPTHSRLRFAEESTKRGFDFKLVVPDDFEIIESLEIKNSIVYRGQILPLPEVVICNLGSTIKYFGLALIRFFEAAGVLVLNPSVGIENSKDKMRSLQILSQNQLPIPKTMLVHPPFNLDQIKKNFDFPVVIKVLSGNRGRGVMLCKTPDDLEDVLQLYENLVGSNLNLIVQEFISHTQGRDIRVFVLGSKPLGAMLRCSKPGQFKSNFSMGGSLEKMEMTPEIEQIAVEAACCMELKMAGVDILLDREGYKVCEVNSSPGFKGFEQATGVDVAREVFDFIERQAQGA